MPEQNGKTPWLLWLAGGLLFFITTGMTLLTNAVIANDRIRSEEDYKIRDKIEVLFRENQIEHSKIISQLTRIETKIEK